MTTGWTDSNALTLGDGGVLTVEHHSDEDAATALARLGDTPTVIGWSGRSAGFVTSSPSPDLFEMRAFDGSNELRWYRSPDGSSRTVLIRETDEPTGEGLPFERRITGARMMVWGTGTGERSVRSRQVGELVTPVEVPAGAQLVIDVVEYVGRHPESGTAVVIEERLCGLRVAEADEGDG